MFHVQPSEDEESHNSESSEEELEATVTEANLGNFLSTPEINMVIPTSEPDNQSAVSIPPDTANHQIILATSDAADMQVEAEISSPKIHTIIIRNPEAVSASDNGEKYKDEEQDDSSFALSLDTTEACSESTSQTFYSPLNSVCVTPEPKPSTMTQLNESAMTVMPTEVESRSADQSNSLVSLPTSTKSNSSSTTSGSTSSLQDFNEDTKEKSKFSSFFQIRKKSLSQNT